MLGPLEDLLSKAGEDLPSQAKEQIFLVHRNSLRLLKLVNTLLDFSRIEAGRIQASYEPTDLAAYTAELAGVFRSAVEKAGMRLNVDCPPLPEPIYVDREMWEKIMLNLLSNAFKFTFEGEIAVSQRWLGDRVEFDVKDTGTGIAPEEMPRLFERFHRIRGVRARTHEGTGIGLALVQELAKLHDGHVKAASIPGKGTTFTVSIPVGFAHLPQERIGAARTLASTTTGAAPFIEEVMKWLPEEAAAARDCPFAVENVQVPIIVTHPEERARVLLADDNADMRGYIRRLLSGYYNVEAVADGSAALAVARENPHDLVLTDVMMPGLDGFELLRELRSDPVLQTVPVILLSARAGEESRVEGLVAGADDYLIKPFSARELLAQVSANIEISSLRKKVFYEQAEAARKEAENLLKIEKEMSRLDRLHLVGEMAAGIGHEIRNPMTTVRGFLQLLSMKKELAKHTSHFNLMIEELDRANSIITQFLSLAKNKVVDIKKENIKTIIEVIFPLIQADAIKQDKNIETVLDDVPEILLDEEEFRQLLLNLIRNGLEAMSPGGKITIKTFIENGEIVLTVQDEGKGIPSEIFDKIGTPFVTTKDNGTGLGLATCYNIANRYNAKIDIDTSPDGTTFCVRFKAS